MKYVVIVKMISGFQVDMLQASCFLPPCRVDTLRLVLEPDPSVRRSVYALGRTCDGPFMRRNEAEYLKNPNLPVH